MKCLTLWRPWAGLLVLGPKDLENRVWPLRERQFGRMLIHAGRTMDRNAFHPQTGKPVYSELDHVEGAIIGAVEFYRCEDNRSGLCQLEWAEHGKYCWLARNPLVFVEPLPWRGMQGIFDVPDEAVRSALRTAMTPERWRAKTYAQAAQESMRLYAEAGSNT